MTLYFARLRHCNFYMKVPGVHMELPRQPSGLKLCHLLFAFLDQGWAQITTCKKAIATSLWAIFLPTKVPEKPGCSPSPANTGRSEPGRVMAEIKR